MSRHENRKKKFKKWRYVYDKFDIAQGFNIEDTKDRSQIRLMEMKKKIDVGKDYEGSNIFFGI